jgi:hypothetical protein
MFVNKATNANPTYVWDPGTFDYYSVSGGGGNDTLTVDLSNGNPLPNVALVYDGGDGPADRVVVTLGGWGDGSTTVSSGSITPGGTDGPRIIHTGLEALDINTSSTTTNVPAGVDRLSVGVASGTELYLLGPQQLGTLQVNGYASIAPGGDNTLNLKSLSIAGGSKFNLNDNDLIVDYDTAGSSPIGGYLNGMYTGLLGLVQDGMDGSSGLTSITGDLRTALAISESSDTLGLTPGQTGLFAGQTVDATAVLIKYTWRGDTNLDGKLNIDDYTHIDTGSSNTPSFAHGDINFDGRINIDDYLMLDSMMIATQGSSI